MGKVCGTYGTALQTAVAHGAIEVVVFIIESGADVNAHVAITELPWRQPRPANRQ